MNRFVRATQAAALLAVMLSSGKTLAMVSPAAQAPLPSAPLVIQNSTTGTLQAALSVPVAAAQQMDIEPTIKMLYSQIQASQGKNFDSAAQANFGAALVDAYNTVLDVQSYMNQLLAAAAQTPLLNAAQQQYVQKIMIPNLSQVSSLVQTKSLDEVVKASGPSTAPATPTTTGKKKRKKKTPAAATQTTPATGQSLPVTAAVPTATATQTTSVSPSVVAAPIAETTTASPTAASVVKKKRKKKKLSGPTQQATTPTTPATTPAPTPSATPK